MSNDLPKLRMNAYYYGFDTTGNHAIDKVLSAVACAGKAYHLTADWLNDCDGDGWGHSGPTPVDWIQNAANEAAREIADGRKFHGEMARESRNATEAQLASYATQCAELAQQSIALRAAADAMATAADEFMNYRHDGMPAVRYNLRVKLNKTIAAYKSARGDAT